MRRRYISRPARSWWDVNEDIRDDARSFLPHLAVYEPDDAPRSTGLLDQHGNELMWVAVREPIGFVRFGNGDD